VDATDGRDHHLEFSVWLAPTGLAVELIERTEGEREGYRFSTIGPVDGALDAHADHLRAKAREEIGRLCLAPCGQDERLLADGDQVAGRLVWPAGAWTGDPDCPAYDVVVDGRQMSWEEFGKTLEPYEGWRFRLVIEDSIDQL
jgi:hypothetical protein